MPSLLHKVVFPITEIDNSALDQMYKIPLFAFQHLVQNLFLTFIQLLVSSVTFPSYISTSTTAICTPYAFLQNPLGTLSSEGTQTYSKHYQAEITGQVTHHKCLKGSFSSRPQMQGVEGRTDIYTLTTLWRGVDDSFFPLSLD